MVVVVGTHGPTLTTVIDDPDGNVTDPVQAHTATVCPAGTETNAD